ncbi:MAG TPA: hypothetical protein VF212_03570 [Longimicrobiales bacterium]
MARDDLSLDAAGKVNRDLRRLDRPRHADVQEGVFELADRLGITRRERERWPR